MSYAQDFAWLKTGSTNVANHRAVVEHADEAIHLQDKNITYSSVKANNGDMLS